MPSSRVQVRSSLHRLDNSRINADRDPAKQALRHIIAQQHIVQHRVRGSRFLSKDRIADILGHRLGITGVGIDVFHFGQQALVEEELPDMRDGAALERVVVRVDGRVDVRQDVDVVRPSGVVTGDQSGKLEHAVVVADLNAAESGVVDVGQVSSVAVVLGNHASVDTLVWESLSSV